jgi:hypothetical protein
MMRRNKVGSTNYLKYSRIRTDGRIKSWRGPHQRPPQRLHPPGRRLDPTPPLQIAQSLPPSESRAAAELLRLSSLLAQALPTQTVIDSNNEEFYSLVNSQIVNPRHPPPLSNGRRARGGSARRCGGGPLRLTQFYYLLATPPTQPSSARKFGARPSPMTPLWEGGGNLNPALKAWGGGVCMSRQSKIGPRGRCRGPRRRRGCLRGCFWLEGVSYLKGSLFRDLQLIFKFKFKFIIRLYLPPLIL